MHVGSAMTEEGIRRLMKKAQGIIDAEKMPLFNGSSSLFTMRCFPAHELILSDFRRFHTIFGVSGFGRIDASDIRPPKSGKNFTKRGICGLLFSVFEVCEGLMKV